MRCRNGRTITVYKLAVGPASDLVVWVGGGRVVLGEVLDGKLYDHGP